jgi:uncharacterized membrane protein YgaE (UPF0421/DUF939 family)
MDTLGQALWFLLFVTPLITIPLVWRFSSAPKWLRVMLGLLIALLLSFLLYHLSLAILFRDGMGS